MVTLWCEFEQDLMTNMDLTLEAGKVENIFEFLTLCSGKEAIVDNNHVGIYRDNRLTMIKINKSGRTAERLIKPKLGKKIFQ